MKGSRFFGIRKPHGLCVEHLRISETVFVIVFPISNLYSSKPQWFVIFINIPIGIMFLLEQLCSKLNIQFIKFNHKICQWSQMLEYDPWIYIATHPRRFWRPVLLCFYCDYYFIMILCYMYINIYFCLFPVTPGTILVIIAVAVAVVTVGCVIIVCKCKWLT